MYWAFLMLVIFISSCQDDNKKDSLAYNPSQPVEISDFTPKAGGMGQKLVIYGKNFGNDLSIVHVSIGGKKAQVIGVNDKSLFCVVPYKAYNGNIEVHIGDDESGVAIANQIFEYKKMMVVSTLCGYMDERGNYDIKDGTFANCGGFYNPSWLTFDPQNPKRLWIAEDGGNIRLLNFNDSTVTTPITKGMGNWTRIRTIDWTVDGEYMIIANDNDRNGMNSLCTSILSRAKNFKDPQELTLYKQCNGAAIHPVNGELYFNSYEKGQVFRYDMEKYFAGKIGSKGYEELFKIQDNNWEFNIRIHPTGNYAYIVVMNKNYILRMDYNWDQKKFSQPYVVCGLAGKAGWADGVGTNALLAGPFQGVFVKNNEYKDGGDKYDFYFTEQGNHDIRILTPEGKVTTFAGRGSASVNNDVKGYIDGALRSIARFNTPRGLAYDAESNTFYVGDAYNRRIRKISLEE